MDDAKVVLHIFMAVLIGGTLWRMSSFHLMTSQDPRWQHLGKAMAVQY